MTNVIPFRQPIPPAKPYLLLTILIDPNAALEEGDRVLLDRARRFTLGCAVSPMVGANRTRRPRAVRDEGKSRRIL
jgi:hypothetical protein